MEQTASFGYWLRRRRKALDLTQEALAQQAGCAVATIRKIEADERRPSLDLAEHLADSLALSPEECSTFLQAARAELAVDRLAFIAKPAAPAAERERPLSNLPAQTTTFIGRGREVAQLAALLRHPSVRLATITGPGGVGKTRLALEVAALLEAHPVGLGHPPSWSAPLDLPDDPRQASRFPDGIWFVNLAPISDPNLVAPMIARALDLRETDGQPLARRLKEYLHAKHLLLLLDNCEQIVEAAPLVSSLLAAAPGLKVLATGRMPLHLYGEHELALSPLALPLPTEDDQLSAGWPATQGSRARSADDATLAEIARYESVQLFVERAQAVRSDFTLTAETAPAVAEICRRLDGLPLALELAAARIKLFPPTALLARLDGRLKLLNSGARDLPARQQTLRGAIEWSYNLLDPAEQDLFARLGVFIGGCTLEAAEAICGDIERALGTEGLTRSHDLATNPRSAIPDGLAALVDQSLLQQSDESDGEPRVGMLETIREYAVDLLAQRGELELLQRRHAEYYLALAERAEPALQRAEQHHWLQRLEREHDNLRAALAFCTGLGGADRDNEPDAASPPQPASLAEMGLRMSAALWLFWLVRGHTTEGRAWLDRALERAGDSNTPSRAKALSRASDLAIWQDDYSKVPALYAQSHLICEALDIPAIRATTLLGGAALAQHQGDFATAEALCQESLRLSIEVDDRSNASRALCTLGALAHAQAQITRAAEFYEESARIAREIGDHHTLAQPLLMLAALCSIQHDDARASALMQESLALAQQLGDREISAALLNDLGELARHTGNFKLAAAYYDQSLALYRELGITADVAMVRCNLGFLAHQQGDDMRATEHFAESIALYQATVHPLNSINFCLSGLGEVAAAQGQPRRATTLFAAADVLTVVSGDPFDQRPGPDRERADRAIAAARAHLGEQAFAEAWQAGQAMTLEQAIACALELEQHNR